MSTTDLWMEAAGDAFEQADCWPIWKQLTEEQREAIAERLLRWADGFNEYSPAGQGCIPNPRDEEVERLKKARKEEQAEAEERERIYQQHIAKGYRVPVHVGIRHGTLEVERKL